jgi:hypothetical protein
LTYAGYIIGFPGDTPETIERDIHIIQKELPVDLLEFFMLTPLPGSEDHKKLHLAGVPMVPDLNQYDLVHVTTRHPRMSNDELRVIYYKAWDLYYSPEHVERVIRRTKLWNYDSWNMMAKLFSFYEAIKLEGVHPLESGLFRRKYRLDRRPGMPVESPLSFYPRHAWEVLSKHVRLAAMRWRFWRILKRVQRDTGTYVDIAMTPVQEDEFDELEMFTVTQAARSAVNKQLHRKAAAPTNGSGSNGSVKPGSRETGEIQV